jgi:hypothetical protein
MKHAGAEALRRLESLLEEIRRRQGLKEKKPGIFYRKSKAFLHFHEDPAGLFADLRGADDFDRFQVNTAAQEQRLLDEIDRRLSD